MFRGQQSNTSVMFGDVAMLKLFRRLELGRNLDIEVHDALTRRRDRPTWPGCSAGSRRPGRRRRRRSLGADLAMWWRSWPTPTTAGTCALDARCEPGDGFAAERRAPLGRALAEIHAALRTAFPTATPAGATVAAVMRERLDAAAAVAPALAAVRRGLRARFAALGDADLDVQRVHGDFHLGQTLHTPVGWKIIDFEGEPAKTLAERVAPDTRLARHRRACCARSTTPRPACPGRRGAAWRDGCRDAFLDGYTGGRASTADDAGAAARVRGGQGGLRGRLRGPQPAGLGGHPARRGRALAADPTRPTGPTRAPDQRDGRHGVARMSHDLSGEPDRMGPDRLPRGSRHRVLAAARRARDDRRTTTSAAT